MTILLAVIMMSMAPSSSAEFTTVARGTLSGVERAREVVVRTDQEWRALWAEHAPEQPVPRVDFKTRTVVAVFAGSRTSAGYDVEITAIDRQAGPVTVRYRESRPGPDRMVAQIITAPFHIVSVPRFDGPVTFTRDAA